MESPKVSLKLMINTKEKRVIFAEAGKDFVDFLFNILSLPIGAVIKLLTKDSMAGCLGNVYQSIENMSETYLQPNLDKNNLLEPQTPISVKNYSPILLSNVVSSKPKKIYRCPSGFSDCADVASFPGAICPHCKRVMSRLGWTIVESQSNEKASSSGKVGGYVKGAVKYMVMDDLVVNPMSINSVISVLNRFNVNDTRDLEERVIDFGMDEAVELLKASVCQSKTVLSTLFIGK